MTIVPLNVATVANAIQDILSQHESIGLAGVPVVRGVPLDDSAITAAGWVGIYPEVIDYSPRTLGVSGGFMSYALRVNLIARFAHASDPEDLEDSLEQLIQNVVSALLTNFTLSGTVDATSLGQVRYSDYSQADGRFTQSAIVSFTFTGSTGFID